MKNILVPIGSTNNAVNTLQYAIDFASDIDAKIYVIHVYGVTKAASSMKNIDRFLEEDSKHELEEVLGQVEKKGVEIVSKAIKGNVVDSIERVAKQLNVDLIISSAKSISVDQKVYLGKIAGGLIKHTKLPVLVIPRNYKFKKVSKILMAIKSGFISSPNVLSSLKIFLNKYNSELNLLRIITPNSTSKDEQLNEELDALKNSYQTTENATIFQGVLEHLHEADPDMLCVIRRKRGFFKRIREDDRIYKNDFESRVPVLVLKGAI